MSAPKNEKAHLDSAVEAVLIADSRRTIVDEFAAICEAVAYNAYPHIAKVVTARQSHRCVMKDDDSWFRACREIRAGDQYVRVTVFWPWSARPIRAAVCAVCGDGCPTLPRVPDVRSPSGQVTQ